MSKIKNILFRADSSSTIGTGHIMRDLVLAQKYAKKGHNITFATQKLDGNINNKITEAGYKLKILKSNNNKELNKLIKTLKIHMIIIDNYDIDDKYEKKLKKKNQNLKILSFDDTYERHHCDILLNHNLGANKNKYKNLVPKNCELRCGSKYTLLRDEFLQEKERLKKRDKLKIKNKKFTIFLAMGGADHSNINVKILKVLKKFDNIKVNLVTTTANKNLHSLQKFIQGKKWIHPHINSKKIAKLMKKSNLAIITPSVTLNEVYFMEVPFITIKTVDNQQEIYSYLKKNNFPSLKKFHAQKLYKKISIFLERD